MHSVILKVMAYLSNEDKLDEKVQDFVEEIQEHTDLAVLVFNTDDKIAKEIGDLIRSAYASDLANGYKDALIDELKKEHVKPK